MKNPFKKSPQGYAEDAYQNVREDYNWNRVAQVTKDGARALPGGSVVYLQNKVPIIGWLPKYNPRWIINDAIAGLTLGLMLIPQSLSYAKIATIPVEYGLSSSWFPATLYAFMGSTKDLSMGPTSLIGLLTSEVVESLHDTDYTPQQIASAVACCMGIFGILIGFLELGFLLEFISLPVLNGFITAIAITIILNQMDSLLGQTNIGDGTAAQIRDTFAQLGQANGYACAIGFGGIIFLTIIEKVGKRYGDKNKILWFVTITRAFLCLVLFTGISYAVNGGRAEEDYLFEIVEVNSDGIGTPAMPPPELISMTIPRSIAVFIGAAVEHVAIARAFGVRNNYVSDQTQELCYFGVCNFFNSFFQAMGTGGAMSRTAVNSSCKVKSPLSGLVTTAVVIVCMFELSSALYWIPKATLAAIIICAVWPLISPPSTFHNYWKQSLADFISSMLALWVCLFVNTEIGLAVAVGFNIVYVLLRQVFRPIKQTGGDGGHASELEQSLIEAQGVPTVLPSDVRVFRFQENFFFANANKNKTNLVESIKVYHQPTYSALNGSEAERNWSVAGEQRVKRLRRKANITDASMLPPIGLVVLDFKRCNHLDVTAVSNLKNFLKELKMYGGKSVECRLVGLSEYCIVRMERCGFTILDGLTTSAGDVGADTLKHYPSVAHAVAAPRNEESMVEVVDEKNMDKGDAERIERVEVEQQSEQPKQPGSNV
ncbi:hypothetical protein MBLNU230_g5309t2 [Neophaeotheca triangularis]